MTLDPWDHFDEEAQRVLRALFDHEIGQRLATLGPAPQVTAPRFRDPASRALDEDRKRRDDLAFANEEAEVRAKFPEYQGNRRSILQYAIKHQILDLADAVHAWRGSGTPEAVAAQQQNTATTEREARREEMQRLKDNDSPQARFKLERLRREEAQDQDDQTLEMARKANGTDEIAELESDVAATRTKREGDTAYRSITGRFRPKSRHEKQGDMDVAVLKHATGRDAIKAPKGTKRDGSADLDGLDAKDREVLAMVERADRGANAGVPSDPMPRSTPNTESAVQHIADQS